jgi:uncharacterized RDD family membrane protein YckC
MSLFNRVKILTPESVELDLLLAGIGSRAFALMVDYTLLFLAFVGYWFIWSLFAGQVLEYLENTGENYSSAPTWLAAIALLVTFFMFAGYFIWFEVRWQGQTPGKRMAKIRVIQDDGRPVRLAQAVLRSLLRPIDDFLFIGTFLIFFGKREKRIGDWVAGTLVVQEERPQSQAQIAVSEAAQQLATDLPQLTDLTLLLPDDFAVIREYLQRRPFMDTQAKSDLSLKLARQARSIVHLETIPEGLTSDQFLEAVYLAYQTLFPAY